MTANSAEATVDVLNTLATTALPELAELANRYHDQAEGAVAHAAEYACRAGAVLLEAKRRCAHGAWLPWLETNFHATSRTASRYMKIAIANQTRESDLEPLSIRAALRAISDSGAHVGHNSGETEWYTPREYIEAATRVMGGIDLDPASNAAANRVVGAATFYTADIDGLQQPWRGRVWMNPPYGQPACGKFCEKLTDEFGAGNVTAACVLVNNATETRWFQAVAAVASAICFPLGRIRFWYPDRESSSPLQGQAVIYLGDDIAAFRREFGSFGFVT